jgi:hypothetical protein
VLKDMVAELEAKIGDEENPSLKSIEETVRLINRAQCDNLGMPPESFVVGLRRTADILRDLRVRGGKLRTSDGQFGNAFARGCSDLLRDLGVVPTP